MFIATPAGARAEFAPPGNTREVGFDPFLKMLKELRDSGHYAPLNSLSSPNAPQRTTTPNADDDDDDDDDDMMVNSLSPSSFVRPFSSHGPPRRTPPNADDDDDGMMRPSRRAPLGTTPSADADDEMMEA